MRGLYPTRIPSSKCAPLQKRGKVTGFPIEDVGNDRWEMKARLYRATKWRLRARLRPGPEF